ncbi:MAG: hypothetical protein H7145_06885 [Akkermansiaceae bacterium]|nr:hypothetical protein [Armatimonadota bacterium]
MRSLLNKAALVAVALTAVSCFATAAQAQTTFAQFTQRNPSLRAFSFDSTTRILTATDVAVRFTFGVDSLAGEAGTQVDGLLDFSGTIGFDTAGGATRFGGPLANMSFSFTASTPVLGRTNLLTLLPTTGAFTADGTTGNAQGSTGVGDTVVYTSDFLDFSPTTQRDYSFSFSGINPSVTTSTLSNFNASGAGTFSSTPSPITASVPEANAGLLVGLALPLLGGVAILRRRKK